VRFSLLRFALPHLGLSLGITEEQRNGRAQLSRHVGLGSHLKVEMHLGELCLDDGIDERCSGEKQCPWVFC
jgi:hypothetical protein